MPVETRRPLISGNWKMNQNHFEAIQLIQKLTYLVGKDDFDAVDVSVHPPFTDIRSVQTLIEADDLRFALGAQNCHQDDKGAFTGEVSPVFLQKLNVSYVIVGHSERRELFGETDATVREKVAAAIDGCSPAQVGGLVIAYEPIWAIGTGRTATSADAQEVCAAIRSTVASQVGSEAARAVRIQYGGSVKAGTIQELMSQPDIDGALVGGASLDPEEFARIIQYRLHESPSV